MVRANLLTNPSFRQGLYGWAGHNSATLSTNKTYAFYGKESIQVRKYNTSNSGVHSNELPVVLANKPYAASAYVYIPSTYPAIEDANIAIELTWFDTFGEQIAFSTSDTLNISAKDGWQRVEGIFTSPPGAYRVRYSVVQPIPGGTGQIFLVDAMLLEQANYVGGYIDNITTAESTSIIQKSFTVVQRPTIGTLQLNADVVINNLILNTIDEDDTVWVCTDIEGWWGHSAPDMPNIDRGVDDGSFDIMGRYAARSFTLSGTFIPTSPDLMPVARDKLIAATNLVRNGAWLRTSENPTKAAYVRLDGQPKITTVNAKGRTDFQIPLRSGDPIKYHWNDSDSEGLTTTAIFAVSTQGTATNIGTSDVSAVFRITGPMDPGSTIFNSATGEKITLLQKLRRASMRATVIKTELYNNIAILNTQANSSIVAGDKIIVSGVGAPFDTVSDPFIVLSVSDDYPYTVSYMLTGTHDNIDPADAQGVIATADNDVLEIDTYNKTVTFNGNSAGQRSKLDTLTDWIKLTPGPNKIVVNDNINDLQISHKAKNSSQGLVTMTTRQPHELVVNGRVRVSLATGASIVHKNLTNNVATLTTLHNHGFSVGDSVTVTSTTTNTVATKAIDNGVVTLRMNEATAFNENDKIDVTMEPVFPIVSKQADGAYATFTTRSNNLYSIGDEVTIALPTGQGLYIATRSVQNNTVTLTTSAAHNFSNGDQIAVTLPSTAVVVNKSIANNTVVLTTQANHNFTNGDWVTVGLPTGTGTAPVGSVVYSGAPNYSVTVNTNGAHGFVAGDKVSLDFNNPALSAYNGTRIVETTPSATSFTFIYYGSTGGSSATAGTSATVTNLTNQTINGTWQISESAATPTKFQYTVS